MSGFVLVPSFWLTDEEFEYLDAHLRARAALGRDERRDYGHPARTRDSMRLAANWQLGLFWQDRPALLLFGAVVLVWNIARLVADLALALLR